MNFLISLVFFLTLGLDYFTCNQTDTSVVTSMKNDLTKSVKKVLNDDKIPSGSVESVKATPTVHPILAINQTNATSFTNSNKSVLVEGGGFINVTSVNRFLNNSSNISNVVLPTSNLTTVKPNQVSFEGGGSIHVNNSTPSVKPTSTSVKMVESTTSVQKVNDEGRISARKGVVFDSPLTNTSTRTVSTTKLPTIASTSRTTSLPPSSTQPTTRKHKPKYAMIVGDHESKERKSFIESPTTGKDYIFPIVLTIMALPLIFLIIKLIYQRGSEYTERRHYDRMYLIDGMYNTR